MKSILIIGALPPPIGGVSRHVLQLTEKLKFDRINHTVVSSLNFGIFSKIIFNQKAYSCIHLHTSESYFKSLMLLLVLKLFRYKVIVSVHSGNLIHDVEISFLKKNFLECILNLTNVFIVMNNRHSFQLKKTFPKFMDKITPISPFISPDFNPILYKPFINSIDSFFNITIFGLWQKHYKYESVIFVLSELTKSRIDLRINLSVISGSAYEDEKYKEDVLSKIPQLSSNSLIINVYEDVEKPYEHIKKSNLLIRPTSIDSFGLVVAEALYCGVPVIASDVCARPINTLLFPYNDLNALKNLIIDLVLNGLKGKENEYLSDLDSNGYEHILNLYKKLEV